MDNLAEASIADVAENNTALHHLVSLGESHTNTLSRVDCRANVLNVAQQAALWGGTLSIYLCGTKAIIAIRM